MEVFYLSKDKGKELAKLVGLKVKQSLYSDWGNYYAPIKGFPCALFDKDGFIVINDENDIARFNIRVGKRVNVRQRISSLPTYQKTNSFIVSLAEEVVEKVFVDGHQINREAVDVDGFEGTDEEIDNVIKKGSLLIRSVPTEDNLVIAKRRRGQSRLRFLALENYNNRCAVCDIDDKDLLVASHIIAWSESEMSRGDLTNVLILCRPHDALFELGFWSLRDDFNVLVKSSNNKPWVINAILPPTISFSQPKAYLPGLTHLKHHREKHGFSNL
jgi:hypothetical protein